MARLPYFESRPLDCVLKRACREKKARFDKAGVEIYLFYQKKPNTGKVCFDFSIIVFGLKSKTELYFFFAQEIKFSL